LNSTYELTIAVVQFDTSSEHYASTHTVGLGDNIVLLFSSCNVQLTLWDITSVLMPLGHGTIYQLSVKSSGFSIIHSESIRTFLYEGSALVNPDT
jgi:hypothetical protein